MSLARVSRGLIIYLWFYSSQELEIAGKPVAFLPDGVDVELVQLAP